MEDELKGRIAIDDEVLSNEKSQLKLLISERVRVTHTRIGSPGIGDLGENISRHRSARVSSIDEGVEDSTIIFETRLLSSVGQLLAVEVDSLERGSPSISSCTGKTARLALFGERDVGHRRPEELIFAIDGEKEHISIFVRYSD